MSSNPLSYEAYAFSRAGAPSDVLKRTTFDIPADSELGDDEVDIKVMYCSLNPVGYKTMGLIPTLFIKPKPNIAESDYSGVVARVGRKVDRIAPGDFVFGGLPMAGVRHKSGGLSQRVIVSKEFVYKLKSDARLSEASGLGIATGTSYWALTERLNVAKGQTVIINGASGGTGTAAVQIARKLVGPEGTVIGICSAANSELVKQLGANWTVDYNEKDYLSRLPTNADYVFDCIGSIKLLSHCPMFLKPEGVFFSIASDPEARFGSIGNHIQRIYYTTMPTFLGGIPRTCKQELLHLSESVIQGMGNMFSSGDIKVLIDSVYPFTDEGIIRAYDRMMSHRAKGKIIVSVQEVAKNKST